MAKGLRLLFLSYWSAEEPLVQSTILPYLKLMAEGRLVDQVWLVVVVAIQKMRCVGEGEKLGAGGDSGRIEQPYSTEQNTTDSDKSGKDQKP